jgi:maleate cis-trans isomerase
MKGWRARIGFMVPPGNPTVEPEMYAMAPRGVSLHFTRMSASGAAGTHAGQDERNRSQIESLDSCMELLSMVSPNVVVMAHTATSYTLGRAAEADLVARIEKRWNIPFVTAFGSVMAAFSQLGIKRIAYATPYGEATTLQGVEHLRLHGIDVVSYGRLADVSNIYEETDERAYAVARQVDTPAADAVFLSGVGMPTLEVLELLEQDLRKPVISAASAMMWHALRVSGIREPVQGFGKLLREV